jgi:hypothetical protein
MSDFTTAEWPINLTDIVSASVQAHERMSALFAEPAATQATAEVIRPLVDGYITTSVNRFGIVCPRCRGVGKQWIVSRMDNCQRCGGYRYTFLWWPRVSLLTNALIETAAALEKIEKQFTMYAEHHRAKGDDGKAGTNYGYALLAGRALEWVRLLKEADGLGMKERCS